MARGISIETSAGLASDVASAADVIVAERIGQTARFEIQLPARIENADFPAFLDGRFDPGQAISIFAETGSGSIACLVSGDIDGQNLRVIHGGEGSTMTILGGDLTLAMDREVKLTQWSAPGMTDGAIAMAICGAYAVVCVPEQTAMTRMDLGRPLVQRQTDLAFLRRLARRNGCDFWLRGIAARVGPVVQTAFFQPHNYADGDLATLRCNATPTLIAPNPNTIDSLDITFSATAPTEVKAAGVTIADVSDFDADTDLSGAASLGTTPVAQIGAIPRVHQLTATGDTAGDLTPKGASVLAETQYFLTARTTTTVQRLKRIIHAHDTVRVMGAGSRHSGRYYVAAVTHRINTDAHTMDLELIRNAWGEEPGGLIGALT